MGKKIKLLVNLSSICFVLVGALFLYSRYEFYKEAKIANAVITDITIPDGYCGRGCFLSRKVIFSFKDSENRSATTNAEISTITLVSGFFTTGSTVNVLYKPQKTTEYTFEKLVPNIGTPAYETIFYTWHFWAYPILTILFGPLLFWAYNRMQKNNKLNSNV